MHVFSKFGMAPDPQKVEAVQQWPTLVNVADIWKFLGLASYYIDVIITFLTSLTLLTR